MKQGHLKSLIDAVADALVEFLETGGQEIPEVCERRYNEKGRANR